LSHIHVVCLCLSCCVEPADLIQWWGHILQDQTLQGIATDGVAVNKPAAAAAAALSTAAMPPGAGLLVPTTAQHWTDQYLGQRCAVASHEPHHPQSTHHQRWSFGGWRLYERRVETQA
jgi:hypothetical protein